MPTKAIYTVRQFLDAYKKDGIKAAIHTPTKKQAQQLLERLALEGATWRKGIPYNPDRSQWYTYCSLTCYSNFGEYCSTTWYGSRGVKILEADQFIDLNTMGTELFVFPDIFTNDQKERRH